MEIGTGAFSGTDLEGTLVIPATVTTIGNSAFAYTKPTGLDLSKATSLAEDYEAFFGTDAFKLGYLNAGAFFPA